MTRLVAPTALVLLLLTSPARAGEIDQSLRDVLDAAAPGERVSALVYLAEQVDVGVLHRDFETHRASRAARHEWVVRTLQDMAAATQPALLAHLQDLQDQGRVESFEPYWIVNAVRVVADREVLEGLAARPDVGPAFANFKLELVEPVDFPGGGAGGGGAGAGGPNGPEPGLVAVRAPEVWALGYTGEGVLTSTLDTGVEGTHPALSSRWRGHHPLYAAHPEWAWFDNANETTFPTPFGSHGTHTMGTVLGGAPGDQIGVAPGAEWIHAAVYANTWAADAIAGFQWLIDPDGDPSTVFDVPRVNSNSWGFTGPDCSQLFWAFLDACEAAGTVILFSAGNEGFSGLRHPADRATDAFRTVAVAAVDGNTPSFPIASFSSRGPTFCTPGGGPAIKPDISAPGVNVRSSVPVGNYASFNGTSMASPHVNGVMTLMFQANPDLTVTQAKQIVYQTAQNLGPAGEDNDYGWGMVDAFDAVQAALDLIILTFSFPEGQPDFIDAAGGTTVPVNVAGQAPVEGSGLLHYSVNGGPWSQVPMNQGAPNQYEAVFPSVPCAATVSYYFSADAEGNQSVSSPPGAPAAVYQRQAFNGSVIVFGDDFEVNQGWTTEVLGAASGQWQRGVPINDPEWSHDPAADGDGSGQCWLTQNEPGNTDVDGGAVRLTSPAFDLSAGNGEQEVTIEYLYFMTLDHPEPGDGLRVEISSNGAAGPWTTLALHETSNPLEWYPRTISETDLAEAGVALTAAMALRVTATDEDPASIVEAGFDGVAITRRHCGADCPYDLDGNGAVGITDLLDLLAAWGAPWGITDLLDLLAAWGPC